MQWQGVHTAALCEIIVKHLKTLEEKLSFYFSSVSTECLDWVRDPYSSASVVGKEMTLQEQEELIELRQNRGYHAFGQFLVGYCQGVPPSGKQSYFDIAPFFHYISV
ncbi:zinc finger BED domain-containing protein 5 [Trichonephila clavata]|uniref:Zinc finger BED domain-containing protein 5 n=1 Tax=Trichonephila clavata TaxID=2740835 RepID=A0A8X6FQQ7_TRICU|nr:zinc finger BED domain-containing protein 5 [Trichonephila clavata]